MTHQPGVYMPLRALFLVFNTSKLFNRGNNDTNCQNRMGDQRISSFPKSTTSRYRTSKFKQKMEIDLIHLL